MSLNDTLKKGIKMNKKELLSVMIKHGDTGYMLAKFLGLSHQSFSSKLNEKQKNGFTQPEILKIKNKYNLTPNQIDLIFFNQTVS